MQPQAAGTGPATLTPAARAEPAVGVKASGHVYFWQGGSLWIGTGRGRTEWHDHHAWQLALGLEGECRFRTADDGVWSAFRGAVVPSHCSHQFEVEGATMAHLFVEPETAEGRWLARNVGSDGIGVLPEPALGQMTGLLLSAYRSARAAQEFIDAGQAALRRYVVTVPHPSAEDRRIVLALEFIHARLQEPISLDDVARAVHLSTGRLRHLFVAHTGTTYRAYVLWARLNLALAAAMEGMSWTDAAQRAGFADSAHLSRTFKRMFGIMPTALGR